MENLLSIKERILLYLDLKGIKRVSFYSKTGLSASNFKSTGLKSELGVDKLIIIMDAYPELYTHFMWVLKGQGNIEKLITENSNTKKGKPVKDFPDFSDQNILDALANIYALVSVQDKGVMLLLKQIEQIKESQSEILKNLI